MPDMLVKLYDLPPFTPNPLIRRGIAPEKHIVLEWVQEYFSDYGTASVMLLFITIR